MTAFRELRRKDRSLDSTEAIGILEKSEFGILCTCDGSYPYAVPVNYVYKDGFIYIHSANQGHKVDNIKKNNKVSFVVVGDYEILPREFSTRYESVVVFGKARILKGKDVVEPLREIVKKYSPTYQEEAERTIEEHFKGLCIIEIHVEHIQGKRGR